MYGYVYTLYINMHTLCMHIYVYTHVYIHVQYNCGFLGQASDMNEVKSTSLTPITARNATLWLFHIWE